MTCLCYSLVVIATVIWAYVTYLLFKISQKTYGGKWTMVNPPLMAGWVIIFLVMLVSNPLSLSMVFEYPVALQLEFGSGLIAMKVIAGVLLVTAMYKIYGITFSTTGFMEDLKED